MFALCSLPMARCLQKRGTRVAGSPRCMTFAQEIVMLAQLCKLAFTPAPLRARPRAKRLPADAEPTWMPAPRPIAHA